MHSIFGAQCYTWLRNNREPWYEPWGVTLENGGEQQACLKFCKRHANTDTRASPKGEVGQWRHLLPIDRVPTFRTEYILITPDFGQMMQNPLTKNCNRASLEVIAIEVKGFDSLACECPCGRIYAPRFIDNPFQVGQI